MNQSYAKPSTAFTAASWLALLGGFIVFLVGLWNADMQLNERGYYFSVLILGLFSAVSLQKTVRDKLEGMAITSIYYSLCWVAFILSVLLMCVGLWNASLALSEKGFYGVTFFMTLFGAIAVQKNTRDSAASSETESSSLFNNVKEPVKVED
ncbi:YiaAB two helix domain-containing protein [Yersinia massiliensis]|uniref:inner membrane protein YiaA n=1 Tax=Yersinia massiliensis TaxID=419257 RepID=UPI0005E66614|nr:inner membrane protein YiaA [Yersinia massiliensis]CNI28479.1 YiaAB two helix domain-containing protein [Yersinia massiliensis]